MFSKITFSWQQMLLTMLVAFTLGLSSCKDDDPTPDDTNNNPTNPDGKDTTAPTAKLTTSATSEVVWNTVTLTIEATDDVAIDKIELKIDGTSVKTATTSPFDFAWDTQKFTEGQHTITVTGTDKAGNTKSVELKATVQNVLLKTTVASDFLGIEERAERGFIFLSDKDGKTIVAQEFKNGDAIELRASTFNENIFTATQVIYNSDGYASITTFVNVARGNWVLTPSGAIDNDIPSVGQASLTFSNADPNIVYSLYTNNDYTEFVKDNVDANLSLLSNPGILYVEEREGTHYGFFNNVKVGTNSPIDLSKVSKTLTEETLHTPDGFGSTQIRIFGLHTATTKNRDYIPLRGPEFTDEYTLTYPANEFPAYYSETTLEGNNIFAYIDVKKVYDLTPLKATVNVSLTGNKYTGSVTGDADFVFYYLTGGESNFDWAFVGPAGDQSILIPEVPEIVAAVIDPIEMEDTSTGITVVDLLDLTGGYNALLQSVRASTYGFSDLFKDFVTETKELQIDEIPGSNNSGSRKSNGREAHRRFTDTWR